MAPATVFAILSLLAILDVSTSHPTRNDPITSEQYTLLAPTNDAFAAISPKSFEARTSIPAYDLLLTLLRNFIFPGRLGLEDGSPKSGLQAVEGFMFDIGLDESIETNEGMTQSAVPIKKQANITLDEQGHPVTVPASNGIIYKIDRMLDPLVTYFGEDAPGFAANHPPAWNNGRCPAPASKPDNTSPLLEQVDPGFVDRLAPYSMDTAVNERTVYLVPSNSAFNVLPASIVQSVTQPSNHGANSFLLEFGLGEYVERSLAVQSRSGFNTTIDTGRANNARLQERTCADNGCVRLVGRWLDPLYGSIS